MDSGSVPTLQREDALSSIRGFSRQAVVQTWLPKSAIGRALMGEMKRAIAREQAAWSQNMQDKKRMKSKIVLAAAIIAAVRSEFSPIARNSQGKEAPIASSRSFADRKSASILRLSFAISV